jgi:germacradienol/geosmin synthase
VENFLEVGRMKARDIVTALMTARMEEFEHIVATDLPAMFEDLGLGDDVRKVLTRHVEDLKEWMSGIPEWHRKCARYTEAELQRGREPEVPSGFSFLPTGLGTSAARVRRWGTTLAAPSA